SPTTMPHGAGPVLGCALQATPIAAQGAAAERNGRDRAKELDRDEDSGAYERRRTRPVPPVFGFACAPGDHRERSATLRPGRALPQLVSRGRTQRLRGTVSQSAKRQPSQ